MNSESKVLKKYPANLHKAPVISVPGTNGYNVMWAGCESLRVQTLGRNIPRFPLHLRPVQPG